MPRSLRGRMTIRCVLTLGIVLAAAQATSAPLCATSDQVQQVRDFYAKNPGTMPAIAARRLNVPEASVVSALPTEWAASAAGSQFMEIWNAMTQWKEVTFLIMKGPNVFEIQSGIGKVEKSKTSSYTNIEYVHPLRGHLRPDLYESIYAVAIPGKEEGKPVRGILFYDADGAHVFGAFMSGDLQPPPSEIAKFDEVMKLVRSKAQVCGGRST